MRAGDYVFISRARTGFCDGSSRGGWWIELCRGAQRRVPELGGCAAAILVKPSICAVDHLVPRRFGRLESEDTRGEGGHIRLGPQTLRFKNVQLVNKRLNRRCARFFRLQEGLIPPILRG